MMKYKTLVARYYYTLSLLFGILVKYGLGSLSYLAAQFKCFSACSAAEFKTVSSEFVVVSTLIQILRMLMCLIKCN